VTLLLILPTGIHVTVLWSVCPICALCSNGRRYRRGFFCVRQPHVSLRSRYNLVYIAQPPSPQIIPESIVHLLPNYFGPCYIFYYKNVFFADCVMPATCLILFF